MKIVRIFGTAYSGATVLGFIINTAPGFLYGSEIYRLLPANIKKLNKAAAVCSFCGDECEIWSPHLKKEIMSLNLRYVDEMYPSIKKHNGDIKYLVENSKSVNRYSNNFGDHVNLVSTKHPIRLLSSHFYHRRKSFFNAQSIQGLEKFRLMLDEQPELVATAANTISNELFKHYETNFKGLPQFTVIQVDNLAQTNFASIRELELLLNLKAGSFDPLTFSKYEAHTIGGNKMPSNQRAKHIGVESKANNPRFQYYDNAESFGDFKVDDKFKITFSPKTLSIVQKAVWYQRFCELLDYDPSVE